MKKALVVGSNGPKNADPLKYAQDDASRFAQTVGRPACGFSVESIISPEVSAHAVRAQLFNVADSCKEDDVFLCYFSGHGVLEQGDLHLLLESTDTDRLLATSLAIHDFIRALQYCKAGSKVLILDCCHAGAVSSLLGLKGGLGIPIDELGIPKEHLCVLTASGRLEKAREVETLKSSFFTHCLVQGLGVYKDSADIDGDGAISIEDITRAITQMAASWNEGHPNLKVPSPQLIGRLRGPLYLLPNPLWDWSPIELPWPDDIILVPLPVALIENSESILYAACLSRHPITNHQYSRFMAATGKPAPRGQHFEIDSQGQGRWKGPFYPFDNAGFSSPEQPVVCVSYHDAVEYCEWLNHEYSREVRYGGIARLPGTRFWDYAAYGTLRKVTDTVSWLSQTRKVHQNAPTPAEIDDCGDRTNRRGISDMFGNIWEWCAPTSSYIYEKNVSPLKPRRQFALVSLGASDPDMKKVYEYHLRGGGFLDDLSSSLPELTGTLLPDTSNTRHSDLGFRIAARLRLQALPAHVRDWLRNGEFPSVDYYSG